MFDMIVHNWWRVGILFGVLGGLWCFREASRLDDRWEEKTDEWNQRITVHNDRCDVATEDLRRTKNLREKLDVKDRIIDMRLELNNTQTDALNEMRELYQQKTLYWYLEATFFSLTVICPLVGAWQRRWLARRTRRAWSAMPDAREQEDSVEPDDRES